MWRPIASAEAVCTNDSTKTYRGWGGIRFAWRRRHERAAEDRAGQR
jgi:hypothetical protein